MAGTVITHREPFYANNGFTELPNPPPYLADKIQRADIKVIHGNGNISLIDNTVTYIRCDKKSVARAISAPNACADAAIAKKKTQFDSRWTNPPQNAHVSVIFAAMETSGQPCAASHPDFTEFLHNYLRHAYPAAPAQ